MHPSIIIIFVASYLLLAEDIANYADFQHNDSFLQCFANCVAN